jgi:hypothetical protein
LDQAGGRADRRDDQKPGNVIANDQFASPTDLEMTSAFGPTPTSRGLVKREVIDNDPSAGHFSSR